MPELDEVTPDMSPADVRRLIVQRGGIIPAEEALVSSPRQLPWVNLALALGCVTFKVGFCTFQTSC